MTDHQKNFEEECRKTVENIAEELNDLAEHNMSGLYDYFEDFLDVEYMVDSRGDYKGAIICIATGGPHIEVDTIDGLVKLYWGATRADWTIHYNTLIAIDSIFEEYYNCLK